MPRIAQVPFSQTHAPSLQTELRDSSQPPQKPHVPPVSSLHSFVHSSSHCSSSGAGSSTHFPFTAQVPSSHTHFPSSHTASRESSQSRTLHDPTGPRLHCLK